MELIFVFNLDELAGLHDKDTTKPLIAILPCMLEVETGHNILTTDHAIIVLDLQSQEADDLFRPLSRFAAGTLFDSAMLLWCARLPS